MIMPELTSIVLYGCRSCWRICEGEDGPINYHICKDDARYLVAKLTLTVKCLNELPIQKLRYQML